MKELLNFIENRIEFANKNLLDGIDKGIKEKVMANTGKLEELEMIKKFITTKG